MPDWSRVRKVLLVRLRSIGDTILMTPSLAALKSWRPDIEITVLSEPLSAPVLDGHPLVDNLIITERTLSSRSRLINRLRRERFDVAFNMHGGSTATILARLSGARHTLGYGAYGCSWMLSARAPAPDSILGRTLLHSVEQQLALFHWSGVPWPPSRPQLSIASSKEAELSVREKLKRACMTGDFAIIAPAASFESKRWTADGFAGVTDHLSERWNLPSVIIAGPGQEHLAQEVTARMRSNACVLVGLSLKELIALIGLARVFVGNDGGPMHIAAALCRPIASVFGSSNANVWHPWTDSPYSIVKNGSESGKPHKDTNAASTSEESEFAIRRISIGEVIAAVDEVLELGNPLAGQAAG
jgi:ADP-heptose:LPS heptosyltransferase